MKIILKYLGAIALLIVILAGLWLSKLYSHYNRPPEITVINQSDQTLERVVLSGTGFETTLPAIQPHSSQTATVHPTSESGCALTFSIADAAHSSEEMGYLEPRGGYLFEITVRPNLAIESTASLR